MKPFIIQEFTQTDDGIGGFIETWATFKTVNAYLDMLTGTDLNSIQNAISEQSTHILIIPDFILGITDKMRVLDANKRWYSITYSDDPLGVEHHNEVFLKYGGNLDGTII